METRYTTLFKRLKDQQRGAFIPFVTLGDPGLGQSERIIKQLIDAGADALELGFPFSDPVADGPTIQRASIRALDAGVTIEQCLGLLERIRKYNDSIPIGLLVYGNLVMARGIEDFYQCVADIGVDSVLIADVPVRESTAFRKAALAAGVAPVFIAAPDANYSALGAIARASEGYIYLLSRAGVTGASESLRPPSKAFIEAFQAAGGPPAVLGFGISRPEHVQSALQAGAAGVISGSAVVQRIEDNLNNEEDMLRAVGEFVEAMKAAT